MPPVTERVVPVVRVDGQELRILLPFMTSLNAGRLRNAVENLSAERDRIVAALDYLFLGI